MDELKALIAALNMILTSSSRNSVSAADLNDELQQLGLPREHSTIVSRLHTDNCAQIMTLLSEKSLRCTYIATSILSYLKAHENFIIPVSRLVSAEVEPSENSSPFAKLTIKTSSVEDGEKQTTEINIPKDALGGILTGTSRFSLFITLRF